MRHNSLDRCDPQYQSETQADTPPECQLGRAASMTARGRREDIELVIHYIDILFRQLITLSDNDNSGSVEAGLYPLVDRRINEMLKQFAASLIC